MQMSKRIGNYVFSSLIGKGSFAEVYKGHHQTTKSEVAIKMIPRSRLPKEDGTMIEKEVAILLHLKHPNIVQLIDFQKTLNNYYLIFEYCKYGDLEKFINDNYGGKVPEYQAQKIIQQIIEGIKFMKEQKIVHRDLKLANLLVAQDFVVKIADFGFARYADETESLFKSYVGTPLTMAPEILERTKYSEKCDMWSLGIIFYQIIVGRLPFEPGRGANVQDLLNLIKKKTLDFPQDLNISSAAKDLIRCMLVIDENKRMKFEDLFKHDWITGVYEVKDPSKSILLQDLNASILLRSAYDQRRISEKINKDRDRLKKLNSNEGLKNQNLPVQKVNNVSQMTNVIIPSDTQVQKIVNESINKARNINNNNNNNNGTTAIVDDENKAMATFENKKPSQEIAIDAKIIEPGNVPETEINIPQDPNTKSAMKNNLIEEGCNDSYDSLDMLKWKEIYECLLLSKIYEVLEQKCEIVIEKFKKINNIIINKKMTEAEGSGILPVLAIMQMLGVVRDLLDAKISVFNDSKKASLINLHLKEFWQDFSKIQAIVMKFNGDQRKFVNVYAELKNVYLEYFKKMEEEIKKLQTEKFRGFDAEELLYDSLIHLSEKTALDEFISEKNERIEQYSVVDLICEIILFQKNEGWYELEVAPNEKVNKLLFDAGIKLEDLTDQHLECLTDSFTFNFKRLNSILQKEANLKILRNLKEQFILKMHSKPMADELESNFITKVKLLHQGIKGRIIDLSSQGKQKKFLQKKRNRIRIISKS